MLIRSLRPGLPPDRISKELRGGCVRKGCRCSNREIFSDSTVRSLTRTRFRDHAHSNHNITASTQLHPCLQARTLERWFVTVCVSRCVTATRRADAHSAALQPLALRLEPLRLPFTTPPESPFDAFYSVGTCSPCHPSSRPTFRMATTFTPFQASLPKTPWAVLKIKTALSKNPADKK